MAGGAKRHEKVSVDAATRMRLNGETEGQMEHAAAMVKAGGVSPDPKFGNDTSKDQPWEYDYSVKGKITDGYVLATTALWLIPKILILVLPLLIASVFPMIVARIYAGLLPHGTEKVARTTGFYLAFALALALGLPALVIAFISLMLDYVAYYLFSLLFCIVACRCGAACRSMEKIKPYRDGPSIILKAPDFFVCYIGQCGRHGLGQVGFMISMMFLLIPWLKYYINCNPLIYDLDHRMTQQISTTMEDLGSGEQVCETGRTLISRCKPNKAQGDRVDLWYFVPHYPWPPTERRWALGLQVAGGFPAEFTLIVHTTHAKTDALGSTEQLVVSNSVEEPGYRVMLWYSNPYHFLTGWVEASISTGLPSQPEKRLGGEHPMWLVSGRTHLTAGRDSFCFSTGRVDRFFDYWLPAFVHEMRYNAMRDRFGKSHEEASMIADKLYQEVISKDGISRPDMKRGLDKYDQSGLADMSKRKEERAPMLA